MFILMPPLWPAIPVLLCAAAAIFPYTTYNSAPGGWGNNLSGWVAAAAIIAVAF
ncbi:MAG TPA: hypothetical protein VEG44_00850 [Candidatus Acidoferrales bacterium]|nr:hypothetical protein [Candidatus Acidoferrales bacterium]